MSGTWISLSQCLKSRLKCVLGIYQPAFEFAEVFRFDIALVLNGMLVDTVWDMLVDLLCVSVSIELCAPGF